MSPNPSVLELVTPGTPLEPVLLARCQRALRAGERVWYLVPDGRIRRRRVAALRGRGAPADHCVGTLRDLALRALNAAGAAARAGDDSEPDTALLDRALARSLAELPTGAGAAARARLELERLLDGGWAPGQLERSLDRLERRLPPGAGVEALWRSLRMLCPEVDAHRPLRHSLEAGLLERAAPDVLLVEGGPLRGELEARVLRRVLERVVGRGGAVTAVCLDLPALGGPRGRMVRLLREILPAPAFPLSALPTG